MTVIPSTGQFSCLIIDDSMSDRKTGQRMIGSIPGVVCDCALDGEQGIKMCKFRHYECIVLDYEMPGKNGLQTAQEIFSFDRTFYILGCTTLIDDTEIIKMWRSIGLQDVLPKQWSLIKEKIKNLVEIKKAETCCA